MNKSCISAEQLINLLQQCNPKYLFPLKCEQLYENKGLFITFTGEMVIVDTDKAIEQLKINN
jgi:hypothetical protein